MNEPVDYPLLETLLEWHNILFFLMVFQQEKVFKKFPIYTENVWQQGQDFHLKF